LSSVVHRPLGVDPTSALLEDVAWLVLNPQRRVSECDPKVLATHQTGISHYYIELLAMLLGELEFDRCSCPPLEGIDRDVPARRVLLLYQVLYQARPRSAASLPEQSDRPRCACPRDDYYDETYSQRAATNAPERYRNHQQVGYRDRREMSLAPHRLCHEPADGEGNRNRHEREHTQNLD
jgi:hypothetical protein